MNTPASRPGPRSRLWIGGGIAAILLLMLLGRRVFSGAHPAPPEAARAELARVAGALDRYRADNGRYPTTAEGLRALQGPYLPAGVPDDPWGRPYRYRSSPAGYQLLTLGRDGAPGGAGENADVYAAASGR